MAEIQIQMEEAAVEPFLRSIMSRLKSSYIRRNVIGALFLGLVTGICAGGCVGAMATEMAHLLKDIRINETELSMKISKYTHHPALSTAHVTYMCLLVAISSSATGLLCGHQAYNLVKRQRGGDSSGKAFALAAPVAVLGVAVTGAALGAILEMSVPNISLLCSEDLYKTFALWHVFLFIIVSVFLLVVEYFYHYASFSDLTILAFFLFYLFLFILSGLIAIMLYNCILYKVYLATGIVFLADTGSMLPVIVPFTGLYLIIRYKEKLFGKKAGMMPGIMTTTVLIASSLLHDKDQPVPLLELSKFTPPALEVLERIFVIVFVIQMFQVSCGADLFYYFVTGGAGKVGTGALAATAGVLAVLSKVSSMLGAGASLGVLLAASGGAGVALNAAGDLGQRYGGHVGRVGAVLGAAVGAFLPLAAHNVKFAIMVALCAAAIPGSNYVRVCYDFLYYCLYLLGYMLVFLVISFYILAIIGFVFFLIYGIFVCLMFLVQRP
ncbi:hypothetical protein SRHO_G00195950 [Serrasalmus rhombeus]